MAGTIIFNAININAQEINSAVFVGETNALGWDSHNKNQQSFGMSFVAYGAGFLNAGNLYLLSDNDLVDTTVNDPDGESGNPTNQV